jgi:hypothetical protein
MHFLRIYVLVSAPFPTRHQTTAPSYRSFKELKKRPVLKKSYGSGLKLFDSSILNFLKFLRSFDKIVMIRIFLTHPDPGGQFITDLPDPEHSFIHNI